MIEYAKKKLEQLVESLIEPVWDKILKAPWIYRLLMLLIILVALFVANYPDVSRALFKQAQLVLRVVNSESKSIPIDRHYIDDIAQLDSRLTNLLQSEMAQIGNNSITPWAAAQMVIAVSGNGLNQEKTVFFIRNNYAPNCACWTELIGQSYNDVWIFISGWVMAAFAEMNVASTKDEIRFLLDNQNKNGSWPPHPEFGLEHASTYATAWALIGLNSQMHKRLIASEQIDEVAQAITAATNWLLTSRSGGGAGWKLYPNHSSGSTVSESISGQVIHALHRSTPNQLKQFDRKWLDNLPFKSVAASSEEKYYEEIRSGKRTMIDHFVQLQFPWMLIATVDAFESGDLMQKVKAVAWIESLLGHESLVDADVNEFEWWRAELQFSLRYLIERIKH